MEKTDQVKTIGMIGVGGSGMRGLASLLARQGNRVLGADEQYNALKHELGREEFEFMSQDNLLDRIRSCETVIYSDAVKEGHFLRTRALENKVRTISYSEALGEFAMGFTTIAIAGTHGKSSTTAMIARILTEAGLDPTVVIGAGVSDWGGKHSRLGKSEYLVVEADEYRDHFLSLNPKFIVITAIEYDHPDYFPDLSSVIESYETFLEKLEEHGTIITLKSVKDKHETMSWPLSTVTIEDNTVEKVKAGIPGRHMKLNALLALRLADELGIKKKVAMDAINNFKGIKRRFETLGRFGNAEVVSDYGHHPTAITATLQAAREKYDDKKILVLFEGHTADRLVVYEKEFARALSLADGLIIVPPYLPKGREQGEAAASRALRKIDRDVRGNGRGVTLVQDYKQLQRILNERVNDYDVIIGFSAGILDSKLRLMCK